MNKERTKQIMEKINGIITEELKAKCEAIIKEIQNEMEQDR